MALIPKDDEGVAVHVEAPRFVSNIVHFHRFADLPVDEEKEAQFLCFGHEWRLALRPSGSTTTNIELRTSGEIRIQYQVVTAFVCDPAFVRNGYFGSRSRNAIHIGSFERSKALGHVCVARERYCVPSFTRIISS